MLSRGSPQQVGVTGEFLPRFGLLSIWVISLVFLKSRGKTRELEVFHYNIFRI